MASFFWVSIARISFSMAESGVTSGCVCATNKAGRTAIRADNRTRCGRPFAHGLCSLTAASSAWWWLFGLVDERLVLCDQAPLAVGLDAGQRESSRNLVDLAMKLNDRIRLPIEN